MLKLELKRLFKSPKNIGVVFCMIVFSFFILYQLNEKRVEYDEVQLKELYAASAIAKQEKEQLKYVEETPEVAEANEYWDFEGRYASYLRGKFNPLSDKDIFTKEERTTLEKDRYRHILDAWDKEYNKAYLELAKTQKELKKEIILREYLLEHKIEQYDTPYEVNTMNYLVNFFQSPNVFVFLILIAFASIDVITKDFDCDSYKPLYTMPVARKKIIRSKVEAVLLFALFAISVAILLPSVAAAWIGGTGILEYPQVMEDFSIWIAFDYVLKCMLILLVLILFTISVITLVSVSLRNGTSAMMAIGSYFIILYCMSELELRFPSVLYYIPLFSVDVAYTVNVKNFSILLFSVCSLFMIILSIWASERVIETADLSGGDA